MTRIFKFGFISLVLLYVYTPIFILIVNSLNAARYGNRWGGFTFKWYEKLFDNDALMQAAWHTLLLGVSSATAATVIGTLAAVALQRYRFYGKGAGSSLVFVTMLTPDIVMAIALLILFITLGIELGYISLLISHITFCLPFVIISVFSRLKGVDMTVTEAARDLGANEWHVFSKIILPMILPAVASGWLLSFTLSIDDVIVSAFVTGPSYEILPLKVYSMVRIGVSPEVNAISTLLFAISVILIVISQLLLRYKGDK